MYKGKLLVAQPVFYNDVFSQSVVVIIEDNEEGSMGLILNKPLQQNINQLIQDIEDKSVVYEGGPVQQSNIYYIHNRPDIIDNSVHIRSEFYWSGNFNTVKEKLQKGELHSHNIRFYLGYAGWESEQLQGEIERNAWHVMNNSLDLLHPWSKDLWQKQLKILGGDNIIWVNSPIDPMLN